METFNVVPADSTSLWLMVPFVVLMAGMALFFISILNSSKNTKVNITSETVQIKGGVYGKSIPKDALLLDDAEILNLDRQRQYGIIRTNGIGLPGYSAGWFRTSGGDKVLAFVTNRKKVVRIPTTNGYDLMLSMEEPEAFLEALK